MQVQVLCRLATESTFHPDRTWTFRETQLPVLSVWRNSDVKINRCGASAIDRVGYKLQMSSEPNRHWTWLERTSQSAAPLTSLVWLTSGTEREARCCWRLTVRTCVLNHYGFTGSRKKRKERKKDKEKSSEGNKLRLEGQGPFDQIIYISPLTSPAHF